MTVSSRNIPLFQENEQTFKKRDKSTQFFKHSFDFITKMSSAVLFRGDDLLIFLQGRPALGPSRWKE
jgi:hypothetical protein